LKQETFLLSFENINLGDGFLKTAITLLSDFPKQIEIDGKLVSSDKYLYESITNIMSTLVIVPVCNHIFKNIHDNFIEFILG
jgi:hypothetical protein